MRQFTTHHKRQLWQGAAGLLVTLGVVSAAIGIGHLSAGDAAGRVAARATSTPPIFGMRPPAEADTLMVEVTESRHGTPVDTVFERTLHDRMLVARVQAELESSMPRVIGPHTNMNCPAWTGFVAYTYVLSFFSAGALVERATGDTLSDCRFWTIHTRNASVVRCCPDFLPSSLGSQSRLTFWALLQQQTGAPLPLAGSPSPSGA